MTLGPIILPKMAAAETCCLFEQHVCERAHRAHRSAPHATHTFAATKFVASWDMSGEHAHPIPPAAMVWLHAVDADGDAALFDRLCSAVPRLFFDAVAVTERLDPEWLSEACVVAGRFCRESGPLPALPAYAIRAKSPGPANLTTALAVAGRQVDARAASLFLYHLSTQRLSSTLTIVRGVPTAAHNAYSLLGGVLPRYAAECTFAVTGDRFIHLCLRMHLPSWCTMLSPGGCYRDLSSLVPATVNDLVRPYVDAQVSDLIRARDPASDDIVLFVVACTLLAEVCGSRALGVRYNRDILFAVAGHPAPFVLCDFPVAGLATDAYGFVDGTRLVVCNGLGVGAAVSMWVAALAAHGRAPLLIDFVSGRADASNPLRKYAV